MRSHILLIFTSFFLAATGIHSQESAEQIMDRMLSSFVDQKQMVFDFKLTVEIPEQNNIEFEGNLIKSDDKYSATMGDRWIKTDGKTQWVFDPDLQEVQIYDANADNALPLSPEEMLKVYNTDDFDFDITGKEGNGQNEIYLVEFKPKDKSADVVKAGMAIYKSSAFPKYIKVTERDGMRYILELSNINTEPSISKGEFTFQPENNPKLRVEDLRVRE